MLYLDGLTPGNPLGPLVARKSIAWYWTIHEFGNLVMDEAYWACAAIARTAHATPRIRSLTCTCPASSHMQSGDSGTAFCTCDVQLHRGDATAVRVSIFTLASQR